jgi:hypothetical protein
MRHAASGDILLPMRQSKRKGTGNNDSPQNGDDTQISHSILQEAERAVRAGVKVNHKYDVPYVAGYSEDGGTIYIDRELPKTFAYDGKRADILPFIILHESVEKSLIEHLKLAYQDAHQLAQRLEQAAIRDAGISWRKYDAFIQAHLKKAEDHPGLRIPPDLDLKPYRDEEDYPILRKMQRQGPGPTRGKSKRRK